MRNQIPLHIQDYIAAKVQEIVNVPHPEEKADEIQRAKNLVRDFVVKQTAEVIKDWELFCAMHKNEIRAKDIEVTICPTYDNVVKERCESAVKEWRAKWITHFDGIMAKMYTEEISTKTGIDAELAKLKKRLSPKTEEEK